MVIFTQKDLRVSLILPTVLRVEKGAWTDLPTQCVVDRGYEEVPHSLEQKGDTLTVTTAAAVFALNTATGRMLSVTPRGENPVTDPEKEILPGTARTLDTANGPVKLEKGIVSPAGVSVLDDSKSLLLAEDGSILPRPKCSDRYYFACGKDYIAQLQAFYQLTGPVPLIPRYALGNWWSRYKAYTQEEYRSLMETFLEKQIPITVATIDMDWHWTDVVSRFGKEAKPDKPRCWEEILYNTLLPGWTGYTWNTELFPDHKELLSWLHAKGFKVPLNVHPSQGVRFFEDGYGEMCRRTGKDPATREYVPFDPADPAFMRAYFEVLHHPLEEEGVDFWWLDWQQGQVTNIPGLDPLWALNHYHTLDMQRTGKRPLILSRYAGLGSHRYPLGFSGDTIVSWKSLRFQPYFTATAANAGYTWWSHDIGGHMQGVQDDELYLRWLQLGVFSPINRLHSSNSDFMGKEPWKRSWAVEKIAEEFLRLRHKLIPYLYTANYDTHTQGIPLCSPMYYHYDAPEARQVPNQYRFGPGLLVCPVTEPMDRKLNLAGVEVWLPEGRWTDLFTGRIYRGGRMVKLYRDLDSIPVLAGEGSIVPMYHNGRSNDLSLGQALEVHLWRGNGSYRLYEDDGETQAYRQGQQAFTHFQLEEEGDTLRLTITPPESSHGLLPEYRQMALRFRDVAGAQVLADGLAVPFSDTLWVPVKNKPVTLELRQVQPRKNLPKEELVSGLLTRVQGSNFQKNVRFPKGRYPRHVRQALEELEALEY